jgi:hypothetical protein
MESFYYSVGGGISFNHTKFGTSSSDTELAYQLSIGKDIVRGDQPYFVEFRYNGNTRTELNGFSIVGGIRF